MNLSKLNKTLNLSRPLVMLILAELITIIGVTAWNAFDPEANETYLLLVCPLICLEGLYSAQLIRAQKLQSPDIVMFRVFEVIGLGVFFKLAEALSVQDFMNNLLVLDTRTAVGAAVSLILWFSMLDTASDFYELDNPPDVSTNPYYYVSPVDRLTRRFFAGGVLLFILGVAAANFGQLTALAGLILSYFVIGLIMLPGLRFRVERQRWQSLGIQTNETMVVPWVRAGVVLVILACLAAFMLPTHFGSGLLETLMAVLSAVSNTIAFVLAMAFWLLSLPIRLLFGNASPPPTGYAPPALPPAESQTPTANPLLDLLPKLLLLGLVIYIVVSYFRDHPEFWGILRKLKIIRFLTSAWQSVRHGFSSLTKDLRVRLPDRITLPFRKRAQGDAAFRYMRLNALSVRERIMYFYLSTVRRAEEQGIHRAPMQTPYEYQERLRPELPDNQPDLNDLTEAFVEARYSAHALSPDRVQQVQTSWKTLQQALRGKRKAK